MRRFNFYAGVFLVTSSTLMLQIIQTRILSVLLWYHLAFFVISLAMFGLTAGAVWVYLRRERFTEATHSRDLGYFAAAFAASIAVSLGVQTTLVTGLQGSISSLLSWAELAACMAIPFFFSGVVVSLALTRSPYPVARVYAVDLAGAATGCLASLLLLNLTDGPSALLWAAGITALGAALLNRSGSVAVAATKAPLEGLLRRPLVLCLGLLVLALVNGATRHGLKLMFVKGGIDSSDGPLVFEKWNSFSRISVYRKPYGPPRMHGVSWRLPADFKVMQLELRIDGSADTPMYYFGGDQSEADFLEYDVVNLAYYLPGLERGAVIGVGGGRDMLAARHFGLRDITGVEINPIFIRLLTREPAFAEYAGLSQLEGMRFIVDEARSWFAASDESFDIIQMSLIDTWAATGAGAFTLSENGLYTVEAWRIFLDRLTPRGVFTVSRWYAPNHVNETGRMISLAVATLFELGVASPREHIYLVARKKTATLIVSRAPFTPRELEILSAKADYYGYDILLGPDVESASEVLHAIVGATSRSELEDYTSDLSLDMTPPTDDRPFFFNQLPFNKPGQIFAFASGERFPGIARGNLEATMTLVIILVLSFELVLFTILIPLQPAIRDVGSRLAATGTVYFLLIGIGFMAFEIGLLQRMSIFLGHPIYSLAVALFSIILATGAGSYLCDRFPLDKRWKLLAWCALTGAYILSLPLWLPGAFLALDSADLLIRCAFSVAVIAPAGLLMGFGFPTGMQMIAAVDRKPMPWFWGVNGAAGVLASIAAIVCNIAFGIHVTIIIAGLCYLALAPVALVIGFGRPASDAPAAAQ